MVILEDPVSQANKFNKYFATVGQCTATKAKALAEEHDFDLPVTQFTSVDCNFDGLENPTFRFIPNKEEDIDKITRALPSNKAPGIDKISARVLKDSLPVTLSVITTLINRSFTTNIFPTSWKMAEVIPCSKTGKSEDTDDPCNTRPISLLPIMSKICERSALSQFTKYLDDNKIISQFQSGNRKHHSTETALLYFTDELLKNMDSKKISAVVLLDMSKAFDSIRHDILLSKLKKVGISNNAISWFESYLSNRKQVVRIGNTTSEICHLNYGVPQGTILSPVLFTLYVNDLLTVPKHCQAMGYVDDTKLFLALPSKHPSS